MSITQENNRRTFGNWIAFLLSISKWRKRFDATTLDLTFISNAQETHVTPYGYQYCRTATHTNDAWIVFVEPDCSKPLLNTISVNAEQPPSDHQSLSERPPDDPRRQDKTRQNNTSTTDNTAPPVVGRSTNVGVGGCEDRTSIPTLGVASA
jgi:hypothetical protein